MNQIILKTENYQLIRLTDKEDTFVLEKRNGDKHDLKKELTLKDLDGMFFIKYTDYF